ncbi:MAG: hypothetical protein WC100_06940 [Sterolibacterium sp.]
MTTAAVIAIVKSAVEENYQGPGEIVDLNTGGSIPQEATAYITVTYPYAKEDQISVGAPGNNLYRVDGGFVVTLHVPRGEPLAEHMQSLDDLRAELRGKTFADGMMRTYGIDPVFINDNSDNESYMELTFAVPYQYDLFG